MRRSRSPHRPDGRTQTRPESAFRAVASRACDAPSAPRTRAATAAAAPAGSKRAFPNSTAPLRSSSWPPSHTLRSSKGSNCYPKIPYSLHVHQNFGSILPLRLDFWHCLEPETDAVVGELNRKISPRTAYNRPCW